MEEPYENEILKICMSCKHAHFIKARKFAFESCYCDRKDKEGSRYVNELTCVCGHWTLRDELKSS